MSAYPGSAPPSDPRMRPQDPRMQIKQEPMATAPPTSNNAVAGPSASALPAEAEAAANGKGKQRPLFCVVCASNNVRLQSALRGNWLITAESFYGGAHGP